jgi:hypothetical protein
MAVYEVVSPTGEKSLVECRIRQTAINHVASKGWTATPLRNTMDVVRRVQAGAVVETIDEPTPAKTEEPKQIIEHIEESKVAEAGNETGSGATAVDTPVSTTSSDEQPRKGGRFLGRKSA